MLVVRRSWASINRLRQTSFRPPLACPRPAFSLPRLAAFGASRMASSAPQKKHKVAVVGSGNWGSAIAKIVAENTAAYPDIFEHDVQMWMYEEDFTLPASSPHHATLGPGPQKLTTLTNTLHENVKYLAGIALPHNVHANPSLPDAVQGATLLVFNLPHQFIPRVTAQLRGAIVPFARAISCIKGVAVSADRIELFSDLISRELGIYCGALSGANIANEVAQEKWSETTVAFDPAKDAASGQAAVPSEYARVDQRLLRALFHRPYFHVRVVTDVTAVSLAGALKNVVALAAGFVVGLGWGDNAKAAIMRVGLLEMVRFAHTFFPDGGIRTETFTEESAGVADLITSCGSGRNFRCARMSVERRVDIETVEREELGGQSLQGLGTAKEVHAFLTARGKTADFPLFTAVYQILVGEAQAKDLPGMIEEESLGDVVAVATVRQP